METEKRNQIVLDNLKLVDKLAKFKVKSKPVQLQFDDLVSAGTCGLLDAASSYDGSTAFETWASKHISGAINDDINSLRRWGKWQPKSIKVSVFSDCEQPLFGEPVEYEQTYNDNESAEECLEQLMLGLPEEGKNIMRLRYIEGYNLEEIGQLIGLTKARVSQLLKELKSLIREKEVT
jgi:RNA polymerase sigma factor (sigma-70 family)